MLMKNVNFPSSGFIRLFRPIQTLCISYVQGGIFNLENNRHHRRIQPASPGTYLPYGTDAEANRRGLFDRSHERQLCPAGAPALLDKYTRTRMALLAGADIVIELPVCFATGSAGDFAAGAVSLLDKLGCVDVLCFGSESGDISLFEKAATLLQCESAAFSNALKKALKSGLSFPAARQQALLLCLDMAKDMPSTACP